MASSSTHTLDSIHHTSATPSPSTSPSPPLKLHQPHRQQQLIQLRAPHYVDLPSPTNTPTPPPILQPLAYTPPSPPPPHSPTPPPLPKKNKHKKSMSVMVNGSGFSTSSSHSSNSGTTLTNHYYTNSHLHQPQPQQPQHQQLPSSHYSHHHPHSVDVGCVMANTLASSSSGGAAAVVARRRGTKMQTPSLAVSATAASSYLTIGTACGDHSRFRPVDNDRELFDYGALPSTLPTPTRRKHTQASTAAPASTSPSSNHYCRLEKVARRHRS